MKKQLAVIVAGAALVLAGCSSVTIEPAAPATSPVPAPSPATESTELLTDHGLDGLEAQQVIELLDKTPLDERATDLMASIRPDELLLSDGHEEIALPLPEDRFYVSIAPFVNQTHECFYHSLTTCTGELSGEEVQVTIVDDAGEVLVEETTTTYDNGFVGFWLPRDVDGTIRVSYEGREGEADFTTTDDGATCVTTLQLA
ncbi:hypothetical protein FE374_10980 [Georgenia yuyongxinii]|uniref:CueP family metal-binding protein n=1 Tax=Georgenia yuyongxinii TaxID=2589797 RepID=A0A5B8C6N4_9MICO|nr:CueP family metal-binding protein [Georgenia yuyongxinii]QDC25061.1 hypothetical protein FE374_10980 [Georgenia yuyongxinii]